MNCQDALDLLYEIIDREATDIDAQKVKEHLENCRDCFEVYRLEQSVQELIDERVKNSSPTPKTEDLRAKIMSRLDDIDREGPSRREKHFFRLTTRTLVAAASLVIIVGAGLLLAAFYRHNDIYVPLERAHWAASKNIDSYHNSEAATTVMAHYSQDHAYDISPTVMDFSLLGGSTKEIMGAEMIHLVYRKDDKLVSVFVVSADQFEITSDLMESKVDKNSITFFDHNCRGCRLVYHRVGSLMVITASTERDVELLDFVPGLSAI